mmetsp:Transcript_3029/g.7756  ORF Transcript_3029/g.7756 Transcript_3029/m.7756 type:complete len:334 (-) Transcript_3029:70-1071(-)
MQRVCSVLSPPPVDAFIDTLRSLFESQPDLPGSREQVVRALVTTSGEGAKAKEQVEQSDSTAIRKRPSRGAARSRTDVAYPGSVAASPSLATPLAAALVKDNQEAPKPMEGLWQRQKTPARNARSIGERRDGGSSQPAASSGPPTDCEVKEQPQVEVHKLCRHHAAQPSVGTVKLYIEPKKGGGGTSALCDAHVEFKERQLIVQAFDRNGQTWTLRTHLPGPIVPEDCRFGVCKTGKELSISLKKADENEEWQVKDRISFGDSQDEVLAVKAKERSVAALSARCDFLVTPAKEMLQSDVVTVYQGGSDQATSVKDAGEGNSSLAQEIHIRSFI